MEKLSSLNSMLKHRLISRHVSNVVKVASELKSQLKHYYIKYNNCETDLWTSHLFPGPVSASTFTCTASSLYHSYHTCNKAFDTKRSSAWWTRNGDYENSWIKIQFPQSYIIHKFEVHQYGGSSSPLMKEIDISFSTEATKTEQLVNNTSVTVHLDPPVDTSFVSIATRSFYEQEKEPSYIGIYHIIFFTAHTHLKVLDSNQN